MPEEPAPRLQPDVTKNSPMSPAEAQVNVTAPVPEQEQLQEQLAPPEVEPTVPEVPKTQQSLTESQAGPEAAPQVFASPQPQTPPAKAEPIFEESALPPASDSLGYQTIAHALDHLQKQVTAPKSASSPFASELRQILTPAGSGGQLQVPKTELKLQDKVTGPKKERQEERVNLLQYADEVLSYIFSLKSYLEKKDQAYRNKDHDELRQVVNKTEALIGTLMTEPTPQSAQAPAEGADSVPDPLAEFSLSSEILPPSGEEQLAASQAEALAQEAWFESHSNEATPPEIPAGSDGEPVNPFGEESRVRSEAASLSAERQVEAENEGEEDEEQIPDSEQNYALPAVQDDHVYVTELEGDKPALTDGNPQAVPEVKRQALENYSMAHRRSQLKFGPSLGPEDYLAEVLKSDAWYQDIVAAGYTEDSIHSALTYTVRQIDSADPRHWILQMSQDFSLFIQDPRFLHDITTKFSFLLRQPLKIEIKAYAPAQGEKYPPGCPYDKALQCLLDAIEQARQDLFSTPELKDFFLSQVQSLDQVELTLLRSSPLPVVRQDTP